VPVVATAIHSFADDPFARVAADEYWLRHSEGFRVDGPGGRIGYVEEVRVAPDDPQDVQLAIRAGLLGRRLLLFSARDVSHVVPQAQRLWLGTTDSLLQTETAA
jgi:hypothetical protein